MSAYSVSVMAVRILLGLIFTAGALNGFLILAGKKPFMPVNRKAIAYLTDTGYLYALVKITELAAGVLLLSGFYAPAGLMLLAPVVVNIFWMHLLHDKPLVWVGLVLLAMEVFLLTAYGEYFVPLLQADSPLTQ